MNKKIIVVKLNEQSDFEEVCNSRVDQGYTIIAAGYTPSSLNPKYSSYRNYHFDAGFWWAVMELKEVAK